MPVQHFFLLPSPPLISRTGNEAGGHGYSAAQLLLDLVSSILSVLPKPAPPVLAAGGLANGAHLACMLALGASGAVYGTRFLLTPESLYTDVQKHMLLSAKPNSTARSMAWDVARGNLKWPAGVDGRGIRNSLVADYERGVSVEELQAKLREGVLNGDPDYTLAWAGSGVGLMSMIRPAEVCIIQTTPTAIKLLTPFPRTSFWNFTRRLLKIYLP